MLFANDALESPFEHAQEPAFEDLEPFHCGGIPADAKSRQPVRQICVLGEKIRAARCHHRRESAAAHERELPFVHSASPTEGIREVPDFAADLRLEFLARLMYFRDDLRIGETIETMVPSRMCANRH